MIEINHNKFIPKSTEECVSLLNYHVVNSNWKRTSKFKLHRKFEGEVDVRVFSNKNQFVTIIIEPFNKVSKIYPNLNLYEYFELIKDIETISKNFYTYDYGEVYLNPQKMLLHITCGDGGWFYSSTPLKPSTITLIQNGDIDIDNFDDGVNIINSYKELINLKRIDFEDEWSPEDEDFIYICDINNL